MHITRLLVIPAILLLLCLVVGCNENQPLGGTVTFSDGTPLTVGTVVFQKTGFQARGTIDAKGKYQVGSLKPGDGIPPGTYEVSVIGAVEGVTVGGDESQTKMIIDEKYSDGSTSGLTFVADGKTKTFDFKVEKPK